MKSLKYVSLSLGGLILVVVIVLGIIYAVNPHKVKRWLGMVSVPNVFVDRLSGKPYSKSDYDGIDVSKHNGVIKWDEVAKDQRVKYVFVRATVGRSKVDSRYRRNIDGARKAGLKVGSYHFFTSQSSATAQFLHFKSVVKKGEQDLIPVLDVEEKGIKGRWEGQQLADSVKVFADLVKKHYGKYPIIYSNEHFYNNEMGHQFNRYFLFIANYHRYEPHVKGDGKHNIWQYSEHGHLRGIGEYVDLSRLMNGTTVQDLML